MKYGYARVSTDDPDPCPVTRGPAESRNAKPFSRTTAYQERQPSALPFSVARRNWNTARKLIDNGQRREDVAALLNVDRTTLYRALAG
jgi:DNA invertase Pin-like site-specific DNA recombinase